MQAGFNIQTSLQVKGLSDTIEITQKLHSSQKFQRKQIGNIILWA